MVDEKEGLSPEAEEPKPPEAEAPKTNVDDLIAELEKAGIENPQQLDNKLRASQEAGKAFQMLGDERKRVADLEAEIQRLRTQTTTTPPDDFYSGDMDIARVARDAAREGVRQELAEQQKVMRQAQEMSTQAYMAITQDPNFHLVKDAWEEKTKNPGYIAQITSGQLNPVVDYHHMVAEYLQGVIRTTAETMKQLRDGPQQQPPHVESGDTQSPGATQNIVGEGAGDLPPSIKKLEELKKKVDGGYVPTEEELLEMIDSVAFAPRVEPNVPQK